MSSIYIYPKLDTSKLKSPNPYIDNLEKALSEKFTISNKKNNTRGVIDFYAHYFNTRAFLINWIEYLPKQKMGKLQTLLFKLFVHICNLTGKKILWVLHNKYSHTKLAHSDGSSTEKKQLFEFMIRHANFILTHSQSGIDFVKEKFPQHAHKVKYVIHPVDKTYAVKKTEKKYDLLIWGTIHPYKGVIEFLEHARENNKINALKVIIIGICPDMALKNKLNSFLSDNITHIDSFAEFENIAEYANQSRFILFTYNSDSVLSSGSLMDSICMGAHIIGPARGAFKDLSHLSFVHNYTEYMQIYELIHKSKQGELPIDLNDLEQFASENNWSRFIENASPELLNALQK